MLTARRRFLRLRLLLRRPLLHLPLALLLRPRLLPVLPNPRRTSKREAESPVHGATRLGGAWTIHIRQPRL